jgi:carboxyl-terminal processing protease
VTTTETPQVEDSPKHHRKSRGISKSTFFLSLALMALVGFVAGTRADQLYAAIAPVFGIKASADTLDTTILQQAYRQLKAKYDGSLDSSTLADGAVRGMVAAAGDKYTVFMDAKEATEFNKELNGQVSGIGCEIGIRSDQPTALRILADSPAEKAGVQAGDIFTAVNGESVVGKDSATVAQKIRGESGTSVKLTVLRGSDQKEFTITRAEVSDPSVRSSVSNGIGTMIISRFDNNTGELARQAAQSFLSQNVKGVVVDLRDNGGGYLNAARDVAGIWLDNKLVVSEQSGGVTTTRVNSGSSTLLAGVKTVVLVNGGSASASEILAGALQDYGVATLVGEKTFGKGSVQEPIDLDGGRLLKVTIARWFTPKGKNITKEGITPSKIVTLTSDDANNGRDPQLDAAKKAVSE